MADDLAAWLTQIWDQDEAGWKTQAHAEAEGVYKPLFHFGRLLTEEMLDRLAADRQILEIHSPDPRDTSVCGMRGEPLEYCYPWPCDTVKALASPYADRPGYQEAWRLSWST